MNSFQLLLPAPRWGHHCRWSLSHCHHARLRYTAEYLGDLLISLAANLHCVSHAHHEEELLDVAIAHAKAAVGSGLADGPRLVGSVNPVSFLVEAHPARTDRVVTAGGNHHSRVVVGGVGDTTDDPELTGRTGDWRRHQLQPGTYG